MPIPAKLSGKSINRMTFSNTAAATLPVFAVTGTIIVNIVCVCITNVVGTGNVSLGIPASTAFFMPVTAANLLAAGEIWHDATPDAEIELSSTVLVNEAIISDGNDIGLLSSAQLDSGVLDFYCSWSALSADGLVVPA